MLGTSLMDTMTYGYNGQPAFPTDMGPVELSTHTSQNDQTARMRYQPSKKVDVSSVLQNDWGLFFEEFRQDMPIFVGPGGVLATAGQLNRLFERQAAGLQASLNAFIDDPAETYKSCGRMSLKDIYYSRLSTSFRKKRRNLKDEDFVDERAWAKEPDGKEYWVCPAQVFAKWRFLGTIETLDPNNYHMTMIVAGQTKSRNYWGVGSNLANFTRLGFILKYNEKHTLQFFAWSAQGSDQRYPSAAERASYDLNGCEVIGEYYDMGLIYKAAPNNNPMSGYNLLLGDAATQVNESGTAALVYLKLPSRCPV